MRKHTRWLIILTATIVLPSLMLFQPGEAKRGDKKKSSTTSRMAGRASVTEWRRNNHTAISIAHSRVDAGCWFRDLSGHKRYDAGRNQERSCR